ncbi:AraC family transcriptional regulator [Microvirga sp. VF16]|uniref:AraC family transcriptional regulator n=1 Tax=Microvirga sp. VF16 TaxID=2807101 RepID=UPI00193DBF26|nr:AraC family transcriptional regulator [Microvirga sp. VF16]QRM32217.1 helix-turn-helix transcriptional regulator [Microvirga sp. VF16]
MTAILDQVTVGRSFARLLRHPSGVPDAVRIVPPTNLGEGYEDAFPTNDDVLITSKQITARKTFEDQEPGLGRLVFLFHLQGHRAVDVPGSGRQDLYVPTFVTYYHPEGLPRTSTWSEGDTETSILLGFWPQRPPKPVERALQARSDVQTLIPQRDDPSFWLEFPLTVDMERAARQIASPSIHPSVMQEYLSAKANELLCLGIDAIVTSFSKGKDRFAEEKSKLDFVVRIIEENFRTTPTVGFLAEQVNADPAILSSLFLERFGCTIAEYCARKRMEMASRLLSTTDMPLKQVAYEVGYNHVSNFNLAFRRTFGVTPMHTRRREPGAGPTSSQAV